MPATRTITLTNSLNNVDLTPKVGVPIIVSLLTPTALAGVDLDTVTIFNGALSQVQTVTDSTGAYSIVAAYPGDVAPAGCALVVNEGGQITISPAFAYTASPIIVSSWYAIGAAAGSTLMIGTLGKVDTSALQGSGVSVALASRVIAPDGITVLPAGLGVSLMSDAHGHFFVNAYPTSLCNPNNIPLIATYADGSFDLFTVPVHPTGYQGAYNGATAYHKNAGTKASPADVVLSGGLLYQATADSTGSAPPSANWQLLAGEPIEWNITGSSPPGQVVLTQAALAADPSVLTGAFPGTPGTLQDELRQRFQADLRNAGAWSNIVAYLPNDAVQLAGIWYVCIASHTGHTPPNVTYWSPLGGGGGGSGTVTSAAITTPVWLTVAGSPITTAGTFALTATAQSANQVLAGPPSGAAAASAFRALVAADLPASALINPMSAAEDLIKGGVAGAPARLPVGANGQVLTVTAGAIGWAASPAGFANPLTTKGDIIGGAGGGTATRLPVGADTTTLIADSTQALGLRWGTPPGGPSVTTKGDLQGFSTLAARIPVGADAQVLTADSTQALGLKWANSPAGFANPMSSPGDIITGGAAGAAGRLPVGANGTQLTVVAGAPAWAADYALPDATPTGIGGVETDVAPLSGHPVALTTTRYNAPLGVAALDGDAQLPSFYLPTTGSGIAEVGRWTRAAGNPILSPTVGWEGTAVYEPTVLYDNGTWKMWYSGGWTTAAIGYATCPGASDPTVAANWTKYASNPVIAAFAARGTVLKVNGIYYCYYADSNPNANLKVRTSTDGITWGAATTALASGVVGWSSGWANTAVWVEQGNQWHMLVEGKGSGWLIGASTSTDGITWTTPTGPLTSLQVGTGSYGGPWVPTPAKRNGLYHVWTHQCATGTLPTDINHFTSPDLAAWTRVGSTPVLTHLGTGFEIDQVADPCVLEVNGTSYLWYDGDDNPSTAAHIGVAIFSGTLAQLVDGSAPGSYTLPVATASVLGGVKQGSNVSIDGAGVLSVPRTASLPMTVAGGGSPTFVTTSGGDLVACVFVY